MADLTLRADVRITRLRVVREAIASNSGPMAEATEKVVRYYTTFVLKRFDKQSRGAGDWEQLAAQTVERKKSSKILVDTREMRLGLTKGIVARAIRASAKGISIDMAIVNDTEHSNGDGLTIGDLASFHDKGLGVPRRRIMVPPDEGTGGRILRTYTGAIVKLLKGT